MQIAKDKVASLNYTLTNDAGQVLDSSEGRPPLAYVHGVGGLIPGLEKQLEGRVAGDSLRVRLPPEEAYGVRDENAVHKVPRAELPTDAKLEVGVQFHADGPQGSTILTVLAVEDDTVHMDANHPLAGVALNFDVTVIEVREATREELAHGHVHGPGGHAH